MVAATHGRGVGMGSVDRKDQISNYVNSLFNDENKRAWNLTRTDCCVLRKIIRNNSKPYNPFRFTLSNGNIRFPVFPPEDRDRLNLIFSNFSFLGDFSGQVVFDDNPYVDFQSYLRIETKKHQGPKLGKGIAQLLGNATTSN